MPLQPRFHTHWRSPLQATCKELFIREVPELTDEVAEQLLAGATTVAQLRERLTDTWRQSQRQKKKQATYNALLAALEKVGGQARLCSAAHSVQVAEKVCVCARGRWEGRGLREKGVQCTCVLACRPFHVPPARYCAHPVFTLR